MPWKLQPGWRQDHRGRLYQVAINSRGKQDYHYVQYTGAEPGYTIPLPKEEAKREKPLTTYTDSSGNKRPVIHRPKRVHILERRKWQKWTFVQAREDDDEIETISGPNRWLEGEVQPLVYCTTNEKGETSSWEVLQQSAYDHHVHYIEERTDEA